MSAPPLAHIEWQSNVVAGTPVRLLPPTGDCLGAVVVLTDSDWPAESDLGSLGKLLQSSRLAAVMPDVRCMWLDRKDPAIPGSSSPLAFLAETLLPWMTTTWPAALRVAALGVGVGGQGALQLAYRHPQLVPITAAVSPAIDFHRLYDTAPQLQEWFPSSEHARQETATLRLHPLNWPPHQWFCCARGDWRFDGCERLASKLTSIGIPFEADLETPAEDVVGYRELQLRRAIEFIAARMAEPVSSRDIRFGR